MPGRFFSTRIFAVLITNVTATLMPVGPMLLAAAGVAGLLCLISAGPSSNPAQLQARSRKFPRGRSGEAIPPVSCVSVTSPKFHNSDRKCRRHQCRIDSLGRSLCSLGRTSLRSR
jgi:hypothetical protein